jgi:hypothetical protein
MTSMVQQAKFSSVFKILFSEVDMRKSICRIAWVSSVVSSMSFVTGCGSEEETLPDEQIDFHIDGDTESTADGGDSAATPNCSGIDDVCEEPCLARYVRRYSPELDCVAPNNSVRRSAELPFLLCDEPDTPSGALLSCYCNQRGVCGATAETYSLPMNSDWRLCDDDIRGAITAAYSDQRFCPPGTFD